MTINATRLEVLEQWLAARGLTSSLMFLTDPECGTKTGKVYDLGTTRLPAMGDFNLSGGASINATGINGRPAWVNAGSLHASYWGNGRYNQIRRKRQITFAVLYERTQTTGDITLIGTGPVWGKLSDDSATAFDGTAILAVQHAAGSPGTVKFTLCDDAGAHTATVTAIASSGPLVVICTYDGVNMVAYSGNSGGITAGSPNSGYDPNPNFASFTDNPRLSRPGPPVLRCSHIQTVLAGARFEPVAGSHPWAHNVAGFGYKDFVPVLGSGARHIYNHTGTTVGTAIPAPSIWFEEAEAQFKAATVMILEKGVNATIAADLNKLLHALPGPITKDLMAAPYNAAGNGSTDDTTKFIAYAVDAIADFPHDQVMTLASGHNFYTTGGVQFWSTNGQTTGSGAIRKLTVNATGATVTCGAGGIFDFGGGMVGVFWDTENARIATVKAGSDRVVLLTPAEASRFVIGDYVMVAGLQVQPDGDPPNFYYYEFVKITGIAGDTVMFDRPIRNDYKSTWPAYGSKNAGPACIVRCVNWDTDFTYNGGTYTQPIGGHTRSRKFKFDGTVFNAALTPTNSDIVHVIGNGAPTDIVVEVDKLLSLAIWQNGSSGMIVKHQSAAPALTVFDNYALTRTGGPGLLGTGKHTWVRNGSHIHWTQPGPFYGPMKSMRVEDSAVDIWLWGVGSYDRGGFGETGVQNAYTISAGTIRIPLSNIPMGGLACYVPGGVCFFGGTYPFQQSFKVLDVRHDATYAYIDTSLSISSFPTGLLDGSSRLIINAHPCPRMTCTNVFYADGTTHPSWDTLLGAPAGAPFGSYSFVDYTQANLTFGMGTPLVFGRVQEIRINVIGANAVGPTQMMQLNYIKADGTTAVYKPMIDLSTTGERVIHPGTTSTVVSASDSALNLPAGAWFPGGADAGPSGSVTGTVHFTIKQTTDQEAIADPDTDEAVLYAMARAQLGLTTGGGVVTTPKVFTCTFT